MAETLYRGFAELERLAEPDSEVFRRVMALLER